MSPHDIINTRNRWHLFITLHMINRSLFIVKSSHNALQDVLFPRTFLSVKWSSVNEKRSFFTHTSSGHAAVCPNDLLMPDISSFIAVWILYTSCNAGFPHFLTNTKSMAFPFIYDYWKRITVINKYCSWMSCTNPWNGAVILNRISAGLMKVKA